MMDLLLVISFASLMAARGGLSSWKVLIEFFFLIYSIFKMLGRYDND